MGRFVAVDHRLEIEEAEAIAQELDVSARLSKTTSQAYRLLCMQPQSHCSLRLDLQILALTILKALRSEGISQPGHATAEKFRGSAS